MNTFLRTEWPWKSRKNCSLFLNYDFNFFTRDFMAATSGIRRDSELRNMRLRSLPQRLVRKLPATTPSGLAMGMTLKTICFLS